MSGDMDKCLLTSYGQQVLEQSVFTNKALHGEPMSFIDITFRNQREWLFTEGKMVHL